MIDFLSEQERKILLRYPFFVHFLNGILEYKVFLSDLKEFKEQLIKEGVSESSIEKIKKLAEKGLLGETITEQRISKLFEGRRKIEELLPKLPQIFPDGNFLVHSLGVGALSRWRLKGILKDGFLIPNLQALKEGKVLKIQPHTYTEMEQISFYFNQLGIPDINQKLETIRLMIPLRNALQKGTFLDIEEAGGLKVVPIGYKELISREGGDYIFGHADKKFSLWHSRDTVTMLDIKWLKDDYKAYKTGLKDFNTVKEFWKDVPTNQILQSFETFLGFTEPIFITNVESWENLYPEPYSIIGWVIKTEFRNMIPTKEEIPRLILVAKDIAKKLAIKYATSLNLPDVKIPIVPGVVFVPSEQYALWTKFLQRVNLRLILIPIYESSEIIIILGRMPAKSIPLNAEQISKVLGKFDKSGSCTGYQVYDRNNNLVLDYNY